MPVGQKLSQRRNESGLTPQEMAGLIGVGIAQMRRYEKGNSSPTLEVIKNIAGTLGVSANKQIFDENERVSAAKIIDWVNQEFERVTSLDVTTFVEKVKGR